MRLESNQHPEAYEASAPPVELRTDLFKSRELESNQQPVAYEATALPVELPRPVLSLSKGSSLCSDEESNLELAA